MAGVQIHVNSGEVTLAAATAKTVLQIKSPAQQRLIVKNIVITGKSPAGGVDTPVKVRLTRSSASFGTGTAGTPSKNDPSDSETIQSTAFVNFTVEPTTPTDGGVMWEVQPQSGVMWQSPFGQEYKIPGGQSLQIEMTSVATPTLVAEFDYEE